jgi:exopolysaccharide biosynthesis polyprenyl glycosylphosphotransferase
VLRIVVILVDVVAVLSGMAIAHTLWAQRTPPSAQLEAIPWIGLLAPNPLMPSGLVLLAAWLLLLQQIGMYDPARVTSSPRIAAGVTRVGVAVAGLAIVIQFFIQERTYSRTLILGFCVASTVCVGVLRIAFFRLRRHLPPSIATQRVVILGVGEGAAQMAQRLDRYGHHSFNLVGFIQASAGTDEHAVPTTSILGQLVDLGSIVNSHNVDVLIQTTQRLSQRESWILATRADKMGIRLLQVPTTWGVANPRLSLARMGDLQLIDLTTLAYPTLAEQIKRALDLTLVTTGCILLSPILLLAAVGIQLSDGGPVFFTQERAGRGGRQFHMVKFRSMVVDAEGLRATLDDQNEADGVLFKVEDDPRITRLGAWLRRWSIDEMPQLFNVLRGDMNLVGPRPLPMRDLAGIEADPELQYWFELRSKVKPGITGPWQVSGRSDLAMIDMVRLDIDYIQNWTLWFDLLLLVKTLPAVLRRRGAH